MAWLTRLLLALIAYAGAGPALGAVPDTSAAAALQTSYAALGERLSHNPFQRPLYLDSSESPDTLKGDVYALVDHPFATVSAALDGPDGWCDVMILHINTKYCRAASDQAATVLKVNLGKKVPQPIEDTFPIEFSFRVAAATPTYLEVRLGADKGPLGTRDYRIRLQAIPVDGDRTFLHLAYSYSYGLAARLAMKVYLATLGRSKVGFTHTGRDPDGRTVYIGGTRGAIERNTMRYYLAIDAHLAALATPPSSQLQKRLQVWFDATEQYPRQLREISRTDYYEMKRGEYLRQQAPP